MIPPRIEAAALDPAIVVAARGLLADFNDAGVLEPLDVIAAAAIGRICGEGDESVLLAAALAVRGTRSGHVCVRLASLREAVAVEGRDPAVIDALPWPEPQQWERSVAGSPLVGDGSGGEPLVLDGGRLYLERYHRYERRLAALVSERAGTVRELPAAAAAMLDLLLDRDGAGARTRAFEAAAAALTSRLAVVAGGPGTGKTYTVGAILAAFAATGTMPATALCAPTGKAAARLGEAVDQLAAKVTDPALVALMTAPSPSTIHRLLGWRPQRGRFAHHAGNRLPHELVVVDEMSMVSLPMAAKLLEAVRDDATVVLVGDPDQLESIEAGTVLADIVGGGTGGPLAPQVVTLDKVHRYDEGGVIAELAATVRRGDADAAIELLAGGHDGLHWVPDRNQPSFHRLWGDLVEQRSRLVAVAATGDIPGALAALGELAVLCARRTGSGGVSRWTRDVEHALDERYTGLRWHGEWYPGRPVMITGNDYNLDLYNGDIGVCVATDDGLRVVFERGGVRTFPLSHLHEHATVHATTIHKSQGSQFRSVVVVLPDEASRLLTRELLYTAVTRAETRVTIVGDEAVIRAAVERSVQRASGLGDLLWPDGVR